MELPTRPHTHPSFACHRRPQLLELGLHLGLHDLQLSPHHIPDASRELILFGFV